MKITTQDYNDVTVVELQGELDADFTQMLQDTIINAVSKGKTRIVLHMSAVTFIDSQGLELLMWIRDYCSENRTQLRLAGLDETCEKILEVTRLEDKFDHYVELAEAVKSFV
jgi:anti-sigma B factor antagonist